MEKTINEAKEMFEKSGVDAGHGIDHALKVLEHVDQALKHIELSDDQCLAIRLAALLHDTDDRKFFPSSTDYDNARKLLLPYSQEVRDLTIKMITLVSCSSNGNSEVEHDWMLYPRWADRLESIGKIGIYRCWVYSEHVNRPLYTDETPRPTDEKELFQIATPKRFKNYIDKRGNIGESTMIDHYFDKLLHLKLDVPNVYFQEEFNSRHQIMIDFVLQFGKTGTIDVDQIKSYAKC